MARILTIDDEQLVCMLVQEAATSMGHEALCAHSLEDGLRIIRERSCDLVILDVLLPDGNGFSLLPKLRAMPRQPEVIVITSYGNPDDAETALRHGVANYLGKPLSMEKVVHAMERSLAFRDAQSMAPRAAGFARAGVIGNSPSMRTLLKQAATATSSEVNVLLYGETGTGKGLMARAIHALGHRSEGPLVTVDCAALTESIVESELFGHLKGSFTGAERDRKGLVAQANGGTLFLDEVGELPMSIQRTFLRVLEERRFRPVGARHEEESDFRLVAATNRNLDEMARLGLFRSDLLYRLQGLNLALPPLRERMEDLELLTTYFLDDHCLRRDLCDRLPAEDFFETLRAYSWPGNVRELSHALDRAVATAGEQKTLFAAHLPLEIRIHVMRHAVEHHEGQRNNSRGETGRAAPHDDYPSLKEHRDRAEREYLGGLLLHKGNDVRKAAKTAGVSRGHFYELLKKHEIDWRN